MRAAVLFAVVFAFAGAACTYDYQGAIDGPSSSGAGGASSSGRSSSTTSAGGGGGAGAMGSSSTSSAASSTTNATTATGGPVSCTTAGALVMVNDNNQVGDVAWKACTGPDLLTAVQATDMNNDCVELSTTASTRISQWLVSKFTFAIPGDAAVSEIEIDVRRRASDINKIEDRTVKIEPSGVDMGFTSTSSHSFWGTSFSTVFYKLDGAFSASDVSFVQFVFQANDTGGQDATAKVDEISAKVTYTASACP